MIEVLDVPCDQGMYVVSPPQRDEVLQRGGIVSGASLVVLASDELAGREPFFTAIAREMAFPVYFGRNWDAVYDCLTDPSVMAAKGTVLLLNGFDAMATREPEQWRIGLNVLGDACAFWRPLPRDLTVLMLGSPGLAPGIPLLPRRCLEA